MLKALPFLLISLLLVQCAGGPKKINSSTSSSASAPYYFLVSKFESMQGHSAPSMENLNKAIKKDPRSFYLRMQKAYDLLVAKDWEGSLKVAHELEKERPNDNEVILLLGRLAASQEKTSEAIHYFEKALNQEPTSEEALILLCQQWMNQAQPEKTILILKNFLKKDSQNLAAKFFLGNLLTAQKKYKEAKGLYESILEEHPSDGRILGLLLEIDLALKNYKGALATLEQLQEMDPADLTLKIRSALLHYELKDRMGAIGIFEAIENQYPGADKIHYYLGLLYQENQNYEKALEAYKKVEPSSENYEESFERSVVLLRSLDRIPEAITLVKEALKKQPKNSKNYDLLAALYQLQKNYDAAVTTLQEGLKVVPLQQDLLFSLGVAYDRMGNWKKGVEIMEEVIKQEPKNAQALNFVGYTLAEQGIELQKARDYIEKALIYKPNDAYIIDSLGWVFYKLGDMNRAFTELERAHALSPDEPSILEHLGDVNLKKLNKSAARGYYEQALAVLRKKKDPDDKLLEQVAQIEKKLKELTF